MDLDGYEVELIAFSLTLTVQESRCGITGVACCLPRKAGQYRSQNPRRALPAVPHLPLAFLDGIGVYDVFSYLHLGSVVGEHHPGQLLSVSVSVAGRPEYH